VKADAGAKVEWPWELQTERLAEPSSSRLWRRGSVTKTQGIALARLRPYLIETVENTNKGGTAKVKPLAP